MKKQQTFDYKFVEQIPKILEESKIYISIPYSIAIHKCACGCHNEVVTPLSPTDWSLIYDGETVSLNPSIGSWGFACRSHYWIENNRIRWTYQWSQKEIEKGRTYDRLAKKEYYEKSDVVENQKDNFWTSLKKHLSL